MNPTFTIDIETKTIEFNLNGGARGLQGIQGIQGPVGPQGERGLSGYTPQKGVDYFTQEDIASLNIPSKTSDLINDSGFVNDTDLNDAMNTKQDTLVSGTNIKTINNESILGSGNINISGGGGSSTDVQINGNSITNSGTANIITKGVYNPNTNKMATESDIPDVSNFVAIYETVAAMKNDTELVVGNAVKTLGYYSANDGGGAEYYIVSSTNKYAETLNNNLKAELIVKNDEINVLQVGAKGDDDFDNTTIFKNLIYSNQDNKKIVIPNGTYKTSSWGTNGNNERLNNVELIGINKPTISVISKSNESLEGTYSGTFTVNPGYTKITTGSSFILSTKELADGQNYYYLKCADKTLIPTGLNSTCYLIGETTGIRYNVASVDTDDPDGTGTARIYLYDNASGKKPSIIFNNSSNTLTENLWVSKYSNSGIWYIDFGSNTVPSYIKTTNRHIKQESTLKNARTKDVFNYNSKDYIVIDCFNDDYYNSPFSSITPLDNNTEIKVYSSSGVSSSLCSLNKFQNVTIDNIKFNGNNYLIGNYQFDNNEWNLIYLGGCKNITIKNCIFGNAVMASIHIGGAGNTFAEEIHDFPENVLIDNCNFYNNGRNDIEIIHGKNIKITNCVGLGTLDIEANSEEILDNILVSNCNFNSTTPYRPIGVSNLSNISYSNCTFNSILCQRGTRINLSNVKCHSLQPYQETVIKGVNCLIDGIDQTYGNEHLHFTNTTFLGLTKANPGGSYGNSKWYFDNCCIDLSLIRYFTLYNNKMIYLKDSILTCDVEMTGYDTDSIMNFYNTKIHNIRINASNNVDGNIFDSCTFSSSSNSFSFGQAAMSGIFKNCYIKTNVTSSTGNMTYLDCILGNAEQPKIGTSTVGALINGLKTDDPSQDINWDWCYVGTTSKLVFKNVSYDVTKNTLGLLPGNGTVSVNTVSDESYYVYENNSSNYIRGLITYSNNSLLLKKVSALTGAYQTKTMVVTYEDSSTETINLVVSN